MGGISITIEEEGITMNKTAGVLECSEFFGRYTIIIPKFSRYDKIAIILAELWKAVISEENA